MNSPNLKINYIHHLNAFYNLIHEHERLRPNDISLYMALFQLWNLQRFPVSLLINRDQVIHLSRIGSNRTYNECLKRLHGFGLLTYEPPGKPFLPSTVKMVPLDKNEPDTYTQNAPHTYTGNASHTYNDSAPHTCSNNDSHVCSKKAPDTGTIMHHINNKQINNYKREYQTAPTQKKNVYKMEAPMAPDIGKIRSYFSEAAQSQEEANKFYFHYHAIGWMLSGSPILNWKAAAEKWITQISLFQKNTNANTISIPGSPANEQKRYDDPL